MWSLLRMRKKWCHFYHFAQAFEQWRRWGATMAKISSGDTAIILSCAKILDNFFAGEHALSVDQTRCAIPKLLAMTPELRHHYRARNWTFDENSFLVSSQSSIWNGSMGENRQKEICCEVGLKCHQSCLVALAFCTKLYIKLAFSLCSFSQFSFPFNFRTA